MLDALTAPRDWLLATLPPGLIWEAIGSAALATVGAYALLLAAVLVVGGGVQAIWHRAGRRPEPEHIQSGVVPREQLLAALATAVRERDDALRELDEYRRAADVTQEIHLPDDTLTLELTR